VRLLGEEIVVWRDGAGAPHALRDLCTRKSGTG
jgi:phenylpropionate dioxygenase-like ring-hydroxylating dioxygenase large terminal subunit